MGKGVYACYRRRDANENSNADNLYAKLTAYTIDQGEGLEPKREVAFYKISVGFEFIGNYLGYTNFRRDLAKSKKIINIERERITVLPPDNDKGGQGVVAISATLSTFRFPNSDAERYLTGG